LDPDFSSAPARATSHHCAAKNEARIESLRSAGPPPQSGRAAIVSKKVDLLCNDLVGAYGELAGQLDQVRTQEGFRTLLASARDLEQLLCHAMDWMLRQLGYSNIAIWLAGHEQFQLGRLHEAHDSRRRRLIEAMRQGLLRAGGPRRMIHLSAADAPRITQSAPRRKLMPDQAILATHCTYLGESLAAVVMFREGARPFTEADAATLKVDCPDLRRRAGRRRCASSSRRETKPRNPTPPAKTNRKAGSTNPANPNAAKKAATRIGGSDWWKRPPGESLSIFRALGRHRRRGHCWFCRSAR
jgi:hypothetical protein